jgi:hypothetical protein
MRDRHPALRGRIESEPAFPHAALRRLLRRPGGGTGVPVAAPADRRRGWRRARADRRPGAAAAQAPRSRSWRRRSVPGRSRGRRSPALAGLSSASIQGRIAFGPRAGARVSRPPGRMARAFSSSSRSRCSRSWRRSRRGRGSISCSTTACSRRMPPGAPRAGAYGAPRVEAPTAASAFAGANDEPTAAPELAPLGVGASDAARVRHRRAGVPAVWRAPALDRHRRGSRGDSRDPRRPGHLARAGGSSSALRRVARSQPGRDDQRLSAVRAPRPPRPVHSRLEPSCLPVNQLLTPLGIPLTGLLSALYLGGGRESPPPTPGGERRVLTMAFYVAYAPIACRRRRRCLPLALGRSYPSS